MFLFHLLTTMLLQSTVTAHLMSSGVFLVRILSEQRLRVQYCFTELPYPMKGRDRKCLKSGQLEIIDKMETVLDLRITNLTAEYLTVEFEIVGNNGRPIRKLANRVAVDGALPAERIAIAQGIIMDFVTVCDRPFYGIMCARQCFEHEGANYVCDPRGEKVCLVGWTGKDCKIAITEVSLEKPVELGSSTPSVPFTSTGRLQTKDIETTVKAITSQEVQSSSSSPVVFAKVPLTRRPLPIVPIPGVPFHAIEIFYRARSTAPPPFVPHSSASEPTSTDCPPSAGISAVPTSSLAIVTVSTASVIDYVLIIFIITVLVVVTGYAIMKFVRCPLVQNWINRSRAGVFAAGVPAPSLEDIAKKPVKDFLIDMKVAEPKALSKELLTEPRYSSPPQRDKEAPSASDISLVAESNTYHEIDSFLVQPVANDALRLTTLV